MGNFTLLLSFSVSSHAALSQKCACLAPRPNDCSVQLIEGTYKPRKIDPFLTGQTHYMMVIGYMFLN